MKHDMLMRGGTWLFAAAALLAVSCDTDDGDDPMDGVKDNRVVLPDNDGSFYDFVGSEVVIEPGEDKMYCFYMQTEEHLSLRDIQMLQGEFGHHAILVSSNDPKPPGTVEDCSSNEETAKLKAFVIPFGDDAPEGWAMDIPAGTPVVLQSHYVNASDEPMLIRDVVRARRVDPATVTQFVAPLTTTTFGIELPAEGGIVEKTFDCELDRDIELMMVGGHMHEQGSSYEVWVGPSEDELERVYNVEQWLPDFRDAPPVEMRTNNLLALPKGSIIRTTCRWENKTGETIGFPDEMCATFGIMVGSKELYDCRQYE